MIRYVKDLEDISYKLIQTMKRHVENISFKTLKCDKTEAIGIINSVCIYDSNKIQDVYVNLH